MDGFQCINHSIRSGVLLLCLFFLSCEEAFDIDMPDSIANGIVFQGVISNDAPPYFFQLTKPAVISAETRHYEGIEDALIVIEDVTAGIKDTLTLIVPQTGEYTGTHFNYYNYHKKKEDEVILSDNVFPKSRGVYVTTRIYGVEGHTYTLDIYYKGEHHTATETMIPKTTITDLKIQKFDLDNGKPIPRAPIISFVNQPGVDNYYLFYIEQYSFPVASLNKLLGSHEQWAYSILNDQFLGDEVVELLVSEGESVKKLYPKSGYPVSADTIFVTLESLSKACYDIYDKAIEQMRTDGGAYSPTPTSVKSNISGDVWGMFRVSAYSKRYGLVDREK
ncbi:DUF4249 family protein [Bacteroides thetaiotaomicron]|uniref:DUF4249 family protein n=1 Tax=Bacteroides thetaiotaomicron TaxID=818 RepID=UPI0034A2C0B6